MKYLSVCSGIEAASVAWHDFGWEQVGFSEIEPFPCSVLAERFPEVPNLGDMTKFKEWKIERPDLLVGGTPCQAFSVAGLRKGLADPRGNLMLTFGAIAGHFKPTWIVWENVPGVLSSTGGRDFGSFLGMLGELGYGFAYRVLDAQYFGVAQRRRRVFVVGYLGDWRRAAQVLFESESLFGDSPPSRETGKGVAGSLASRSSSGGGLGTDFDLAGGFQVHDGRGRGDGDLVPTVCSDHAGRPSDFSPLVSMTLNAKGGSGRMDGESETLVPVVFDTTQITSKANYSNPKPGDPVHPLAAWAHPPLLARSLTARADGSPCADRGPEVIPIAYSLRSDAVRSGEAKTPSADAAGRVRLRDAGFNVMKDIAPTIDTGMAHTVAHIGVRRLTPRECERLQGFPDDWTAVTHRGKPAADGPRYKALGNSMAVPVMRWIGQRIRGLT